MIENYDKNRHVERMQSKYRLKVTAQLQFPFKIPGYVINLVYWVHPTEMAFTFPQLGFGITYNHALLDLFQIKKK